MTDFSIRTLRKTSFYEIYEKLIRRDKLNTQEREALLEIALILINAGDLYNQNLGYRIIVLYSNMYDDYVPLYDVALGKGYVPVLKSIEGHHKLKGLFSNSFFNMFMSASAETYKEENIYLTYQQRQLNEFFVNNNDRTVAVIAPTSYGKSELIMNYCSRNTNSTICILVPTKALLAQTRRRLLQSMLTSDKRKIITHPEMFSAGDDKFIAVLTQERLLRLIRIDDNIRFDSVFIDEAHNLFDDDQRYILLAKTIALLEHRNSKTAFKFLTPFMVDAANLKTRYTNYNIAAFAISETIKTERYYSINFLKDRLLKVYDQYLNRFIPMPEQKYGSDLELIKKTASAKNIIYLNQPRKIEEFAQRLLEAVTLIDEPEIRAACRDISKFLHSDYSLVDCIKHGFVYHHGSVPDMVRLYVEHLFSTNKHISYIITSSTLLEGVNIPAEKLYLLEYTKGGRRLSPSQFKNLSGRVCRFSEVFNTKEGSLELLEPSIYVVASEYVRNDANIEKFLVESVKVDRAIQDDVKNVLLRATVLDDSNRQEKQRADEVLENIEKGITGTKARYATTDVGKICFLNNITELLIIDHEQEIAGKLAAVEKRSLKTPEEIIQLITTAFFSFLNDKHRDYDNLLRLNNASAQKFYSMFVTWRMRSASYSEMINRFLDYWQKNTDRLAYVGKWGDTVREGHKELWVDISTKTTKELINLAIVRIKEETDFLDNMIIKYVEVLNELELVDEKVYERIKYGTNDARKIIMIRNGISNALSSLLLEKYMQYVFVDVASNTVKIGPDILRDMQEQGENRVLVFEVSFNIASE